jgi:hypothetical protein
MQALAGIVLQDIYFLVALASDLYLSTVSR